MAWPLAVLLYLAMAPVAALAVPFAAIVMDARTGQVLYAQNADARLHPASLTKMMTLYIAFDAIRRGEIGMDTMVTVSAKAAAEPPSRLGLRAGQRISMRHLIRAAAIKSANDAATAIGEAISGSEAAFARRMTAAARALGMTGTTFRNAHGLTAPGHLSTARDMTILGRRLIYDFPEHYALFSRTTVDAGVAQVGNTNRRFLDSYRGADGIKTGYTRAAGFNLTASAERGGKRIVATVFGGTSTAQRNAKMAELMDIGFGSAPANVATRRPAPVELPRTPPAPPAAAAAAVAEAPRASAKTIRLVMAPARSPRPMRRPDAAPAEDLPFALVADGADAVQAAIDTELREALAAPAAETASGTAPAAAPAAAPAPRPRPAPATRDDALTDAVTEAVAAATDTAAPPPAGAPEAEATPPAALAVAEAPGAMPVPPARPAAPEEPAAIAGSPAPEEPPAVAAAEVPAVPAAEIAAATAAPAPEADAAAVALAEPEADSPADDADLTELAAAAEDDPASLPAAARPTLQPPAARTPGIVLTARATEAAAPAPQPGTGGTVARISTSGGRHWGVTLGRFPSRGTAERALLQTGLAESATLGAALRKVVARGGGYEANFEGLTRDQADLACRRLAARAVACFTVGP